MRRDDGSSWGHPFPEQEETVPEVANADKKEREVRTWRREQLEHIGLPSTLAEEVSRTNMDTEELRNLVKQGCNPVLAVRILA